LFAELRARPELAVSMAELGPPTPPTVIEAARKTAGAAWPEGMADLYAAVGSVDLEWKASEGGLHGAIHIPPIAQVWDYEALEDELWFDWLEPEHPFHRIRPLDRFVPEAYAVLFPVPGPAPATVHYHYCGESLVSTGLTFSAWLEALFGARGVAYWVQIFTGPRLKRPRAWVEEGHDAMARLFPDFTPHELSPAKLRPEIEL